MVPDEYTRIGARGQDDATWTKVNIAAKEVISEFRNREKGTSVDGGEGSMVDYFQGLSQTTVPSLTVKC